MLKISRLQTRFVLITALGALLFSLLAGAIAYERAFRRNLQHSQQTIEGLCLTVKTTAAIAAYVGNVDVANDVINGLLNNEIVQSARIDAGGKPMVERGKADTRAIASKSAVRCPLFSPFDANEQVGDLTIRVNQSIVTGNARAEASTQVTILVVQTVLTALLSMALVNWLIAGPIRKLAEKFRELTPGSAQRLPLFGRHRDDEIGVLINSSNQLLDATESAFREERKLRAEVQAIEQQYRRIFDTTSAGILVLDADGRLINANPTLMRMLGRNVDDYDDFEGFDFFGRTLADPSRAALLIEQAAAQGQTIADDLELLQPDGGTRWVHCLISVHRAARQTTLIEGVLYDITERKRKESEVQHQAEHDVLTGLKNRRSSEQFLDSALRQAQLTGSGVAVMLIDLDSFKPVNDTLGHAAGDIVLMEVASKLKRIIRTSSDLAGRLGGDEFIVVIREQAIDRAGFTRVAEDLLQIISLPLELAGGVTVTIGASIGIACYPEHGETAAALLQAADRAMYVVKAAGKNGFGFAG